PGLRILSATRALERQPSPARSLEQLLGAGRIGFASFEWLLAIVAARACACLRAAVRAASPNGEAIVPVSAHSRGIDAALNSIRAGRTLADIRVFRLLFLGMDCTA